MLVGGMADYKLSEGDVHAFFLSSSGTEMMRCCFVINDANADCKSVEQLLRCRFKPSIDFK